MGKRHTREERMRGALDAHDRGIDIVARRTGVKPATVRRWCAEFSVSPANGADSPAAAAPHHGITPHDPASGTLGGDGAFDPQKVLRELSERVSDSLEASMAAWRADVEGRRRSREALGRVIADWEAEHGEFTEEEMKATEAQLYG